MKEIYLWVGDNYRVIGYGSTNSPGTIKIDVPEDHEVLVRPHAFLFQEGKLVKEMSWVLDKVKKEKDVELNTACQAAILAGFDLEIDGKVFHFSYDSEAQSNIQRASSAFNKNLISLKDFTVRNEQGEYQRITVDKDTMNRIEVAEINHVDSNIRMYREELLPRVMEAIEVDEVRSYVWK